MNNNYPEKDKCLYYQNFVCINLYRCSHDKNGNGKCRLKGNLENKEAKAKHRNLKTREKINSYTNFIKRI